MHIFHALRVLVYCHKTEHIASEFIWVFRALPLLSVQTPDDKNWTGFGGIDAINQTNRGTEFLLKQGDNFYKTFIEYEKSDESNFIPEFVFSINRESYLQYTPQGMDFNDGKLYIQLWSYNSTYRTSKKYQPVSAILAYDYTKMKRNEKDTNKATNIWEYEDPSGVKFEIEGSSFYNCEISFITNAPRVGSYGGHIYFYPSSLVPKGLQIRKLR